GTSKHPDEAIRLATATLLIEAAMMDGETDEAEITIIQDLLADYFQLSDEEVAELVADGEAAAQDSAELYGLTRTLKDNFDHEERVQMIEMLWEVAYTDGRLHHLETNLIRRIAGLIYVPDRESGEARKRAQAKRENKQIDAL
ncbi:MAG: TerB family tellurite resistance protein, partial [Rhodospirillales bacterium]